MEAAKEPTDEPKRIFVIRDFEIDEIGPTLGYLEKNPPNGYRVRVPGLDASGHGEIFRSKVAPGIETADGCVALVDLPNANVGFEIGYALGKGKRVALAAVRGDVPDWLQTPPLDGFYVAAAEGLGAMRTEIERFEQWFELPDTAPVTGSKTLFVAPASGPGEVLHAIVEQACPSWQRLPASGWNLIDLPEMLAGVTRVVWAIPPFPKGTDKRDGIDNAAGAVVAGYAHAVDGRTVEVLWQEQERRVADVVQMQQPFASAEAFEHLVRKLDRTNDDADADATPVDPLTAYRRTLRETHAQLVWVFPGAENPILDEVYVELELQRAHDLERGELTAPPDHGTADEACAVDSTDRGRKQTLHELLATPRSKTVTGRWAVLGKPGAGKSTVARHLAWQLAGGRNTREPAAAAMDAFADDAPIPVYVTLPEWLDEAKHPFELVAEAVRKACGSRSAKDLKKRLYAEAERAGRVWLLLDGLDEVAPDSLPKVREDIDRLAGELENATVCVFSRDVGYQDRPGFRRAVIQDLEKDAQQDLLGRWLGDRAERAWNRIATEPELAELAGSPLLLTLIARLALEDHGRAMPRNRPELYDRAIDLLLTRGHGRKPVPVKNPPTARRVLQELALVLQESPSSTWNADALDAALYEAREVDGIEARLKTWGGDHSAFLADIATNSGVLADRDGKGSAFLHRQFREFLAAEALARRPAEERLAKAEEVWCAQPRDQDEQKRLDDARGRWAETLSFVAQLVDDRRDLLDRIAEVGSALLVRTLDGIEQLPLDEALDALVASPDWDGSHVLEVVRRFAVDDTAAETADAVFRHVTRERSTEQLGGLWWALEAIGHAPDRQTFFAACGRALDRVPTHDWIEIPAGQFVMGSPIDERGRWSAEGPQHEVRVPEFELAKTTVTNAQYAAFDPDHAWQEWKGVKRGKLASHPVINVSWWCAYVYCAWAGCRLPREAEWEYACRAGTDGPFSFEGEIDLERVNYRGSWDWREAPTRDPRARTVAVGSLEANAWGLHEMHGNVWEWCADPWHASYDGAPTDGSVWDDEGAASAFVVRGGSWFNLARGCRSAFRNGRPAGDRVDGLGFRPARSSPDSFTTSRRDDA